MINYFSDIPILHLAIYCIIFVCDITELMFTMARAAEKRSTICQPKYHSLK